MIMAEKEKDRSICLDISSRETIPSLACRLNVPNFFTLSGGAVFKSPTFQYADATWFFEFQTYDRWQWQRKNKHAEDKDPDINFYVFLERLNSVIHQEIFYTVTLMDSNDKLNNYVFYSSIFKEDINKISMASFYNDDPSFDRRKNLCLIIQLFCEKSTVTDENEIQNTANGDLEMKTTKEEKNCNITLELSSRKSISSVVCTLKIPNFFILPEYDGTTFESPTLAFANAAWCFRFSSDRWEIRDEEIDFGAFIVRLNSEIPEQWIFYRTTLLDNNDEEYRMVKGSSLFTEGEIESCMRSFRHFCLERRDSLTLSIRLFYEKSTEMSADHLQKRDAEMLSQDFKKLLLNGTNKDFTLKVAEKEFLVHRDVLMARSPVFEAMLSHDMAEKNNGFIDVPDCDPRAMEQFLHYVYTGKVKTLSQENVLGVYYTADKYSMTLLKKKCAIFIKESLSPSFICDIIQLALNHSDTELLEYATEYFVNHTNDILPTVEWISFLKSNVIAADEFLSMAFKKRNDPKS